MSHQKILVITYYWPPSGGSGVQRWLKFVKYLPDFGWKPYVFTPKNPALVQRDDSLLKDVHPNAEIIRLPIREPYELFFKLSGNAKKEERSIKPSELLLNKRKSIFYRVASWIRGNFFIPDPKIFWVRPAVKFLSAYLKEHDIQNIVTTGPPHSVHLIGLRLKKRNPALNWLADFRDPWSEWPFLESFNMSGPVKARHRKLENQVITKADHVLTITPYYVKRFEELSSRKVEFIPNGFDEEDFAGINYIRANQFIIRHVGIVYDMADPRPLIAAVSKFLQKQGVASNDLIIEFVGEVNAGFRRHIEQSPISNIVRFRPPIQHKELMALYSDTGMLLLNIEGYKHAEGLLPGKLFEYLATGLPILGIGPEKGNAAELLNATNGGCMFDSKRTEDMSLFIKSAYLQWQSNSQSVRVTGRTSDYSRKSLTRKIAALLR